MTQMKRKILCIDGGGVKGLFAAKILAELESQIEHPIYHYFDMVAGTSTGAIISAGLALGIPASKICDLYVKHAAQIFPQNGGIFRNLRRVYSSKYSNNVLAIRLKEIFQDTTIGDCKTRLLIPSYNLSTGNIHVFKTSHSADLEYDYREKIVDVLLATTAAPTYLPPYQTPTGTYVDGGVGANNPSLIALVEAISPRCQWAQEDICLLSLGCMESISSVTTGREKMGIWNVQKLINMFMNAESQYSHNIAQILLSKGQYLRISPVDRANQGALDKSTPEVLHYLQAMGIREAQIHSAQIKGMFFNCCAEPFHPCHSSLSI